MTGSGPTLVPQATRLKELPIHEDLHRRRLEDPALDIPDHRRHTLVGARKLTVRQNQALVGPAQGERQPTDPRRPQRTPNSASTRRWAAVGWAGKYR